SSAVRHAVWVLALLAVLVFPVASIILPPVELPILTQRTSALPSPALESPVVLQPFVAFIPQPDVAPVQLAAQESASSNWSWRVWLTSLWAAGTLLVLASWLRAIWELRRLKKSSSLVRD